MCCCCREILVLCSLAFRFSSQDGPGVSAEEPATYFHGLSIFTMLSLAETCLSFSIFYQKVEVWTESRLNRDFRWWMWRLRTNQRCPHLRKHHFIASLWAVYFNTKCEIEEEAAASYYQLLCAQRVWFFFFRADARLGSHFFNTDLKTVTNSGWPCKAFIGDSSVSDKYLPCSMQNHNNFP